MIDSSGQYSVEFIKTHVGHSNEMKHLNIPVENKIQIANMLSSGITKQVILQKIRSSCTEEYSERVHLTTNKDATNIAK